MRSISLAPLILFVAVVSAAAQCPEITVVGPAGLTNAGDDMHFTGTGAPDGLKYSWTVSDGTIVEGQGTTAIKVATDRSMSGRNVTATVEIDGLQAACAKTAMETAPIAPTLEWESTDEWGDLPNDDQRARLDNFFIELSNNPHHIGLIILLTKKGEPQNATNRRIKLFSNHLRFRRFDRARIRFCFERGYENRKTVLFRFPPELVKERPYPECRVLKAKDVR